VKLLEDESLCQLAGLAGLGLDNETGWLAVWKKKSSTTKARISYVLVNVQAVVSSNTDDGGLARGVEHPLLDL